jgi:hypothetical protein
VVIAGACGGGRKHASPAPISNQQAAPEPTAPVSATSRNDEALAMLSAFTENMCACTDAPCAQRVNGQLADWSTEMSKRTGAPTAMSEGEQQVYTQLASRFADCLTRAIGTPAASSTPTP